MCLSIKIGDKPKIAKKDIVVYKHVMVARYHGCASIDGLYYTAYQRTPIRIGKIYTSSILVQFDTIGMALHSFKNISDCRRFAKEFNEVLVKCIIPKGSTYYEGIFNISVYSDITKKYYNKFKSYASNKIKYVKIIKNYANTE